MRKRVLLHDAWVSKNDNRERPLYCGRQDNPLINAGSGLMRRISGLKREDQKKEKNAHRTFQHFQGNPGDSTPHPLPTPSQHSLSDSL